MESYQSANKRIIKNTILMYMRMLISMFVSLYATRVVIQSLGVSDYGIFNVISGLVTMLAFINGSMVASTRRFLTISIANDSIEQQKQVFSTSFYIHFGISLLITLVAITFGYWFIEFKMVVPLEQVSTSKWVFTFSLFSILALCLTVPHNALVIANEKMGMFSILSLIDVVLKLAIAIAITRVDSNRLIVYAFLYNLTAVIVRLLYVWYCHRNFANVSYKYSSDVSLYKNMLSFAAYNFYSTMALSVYQQGINILLNMFFNPIVNAARGIAVQVQGLAIVLASNFQQAVDPQITRNYATGDRFRMLSLIYKSSKISYILVFIIIFPIIVETEFILKLWLGTVPEYAVYFVQLSLCIVLLDVITNPFTTAVLASGYIKKYQIIVGSFLLSFVVVAYLALNWGISPVGLYLTNVIMVFLLFLIKLYLAAPLIKMSTLEYCRASVIPAILFTFLSIVIYLGLYFTLGCLSIINLLYAFLAVIISAYICGLTKSEKKQVLSLLKSKYGNKL